MLSKFYGYVLAIGGAIVGVLVFMLQRSKATNTKLEEYNKTLQKDNTKITTINHNNQTTQKVSKTLNTATRTTNQKLANNKVKPSEDTKPKKEYTFGTWEDDNVK